MIAIRKVKKAIVLLLSIMIIAPMFVFYSYSVKAKADICPVQFYGSFCDHYYIGYTFTAYVKVNIIGSNQHVYLHESNSTTNGGWKDVEGKYVTTLNDGSQIWKVTDGAPGTGLEYAIKYEVDGQTYWDNNNNNNYTIDNKLGEAVMLVSPRLSVNVNQYSYPITVNVKNLAYDKVINVRYTEDNWITYKDASLSYDSTNSDGSEKWVTTLNLSNDVLDNFHYAISYEVNGQTYWDNNFGSNYNY